ncbi:hypothetical protein HAX54_012601 [Datura stramonium]|uniref:BHLH domain-containing protein n=1 Tax=Datura stramonium TaxID=4076 RepID=A0ABS8TMT2_DATST|nr:hypothetical protein [Datura stramonium]
MQRGTAGAGGGGLSRFRSAPATWLEALLESDTENEVVLNPSSPILHSPNKPPPHPSTQKLSGLNRETGAATRFAGDPGLFESGGSSNFLRQNSSPAEFLSHISSDGYFSSYGIPSSLDYLSSSVDVSQSAKRAREGDSESSPRKLSSQLKGEPSGQLRGSGGSLDAEMEKLMDDLVPYGVRAKRGCATHPRSIAERSKVRRTRISDRIRKLQELVPNMDKQTNTADMLEEAVNRQVSAEADSDINGIRKSFATLESRISFGFLVGVFCTSSIQRSDAALPILHVYEVHIDTFIELKGPIAWYSLFAPHITGIEKPVVIARKTDIRLIIALWIVKDEMLLHTDCAKKYLPNQVTLKRYLQPSQKGGGSSLPVRHGCGVVASDDVDSWYGRGDWR